MLLIIAVYTLRQWKQWTFKMTALWIRIDNFENYHVLVYDLFSKQDATEICHYPELVGGPLKLELKFTHPLEHVTELNVLEKRMPSVAVDKFCVVAKKSKSDKVSLPLMVLKYRHVGSFSSDSVPLPLNETFAIMNRQSSNMKVEHWIMIAKSLDKLYFAESLGRPSFPKKQYRQMMPQPLQCHPSVWGFYTKDAAFHLLRFRQE